MANEKKNVPATVEDILAQFSLEEIQAAIAKKSAPADESPVAVGKSVVIRTVTFHHIGKIVAITPTEIVLSGGGWLADSGRFSTMLEKGTYSEYEHVGTAFSVSRASIVDVFAWKHALPTTTK